MLRRFERLKYVLNHRMDNLTVLLENVEKPHNLSAVFRSCDAVGLLEVHSVNASGKPKTFNNTAQGSQKWIKLNNHENLIEAIYHLKSKGFKLYGACADDKSKNYQRFDFTDKTAFVMGAEKWGLSKEAMGLVDESLFIPMRGMVESLNVSVATAILLYEALRQREKAGCVPNNGEGINKEKYKKILFEWSYPEIAKLCKKEGRPYPNLNKKGEIQEII